MATLCGTAAAYKKLPKKKGDKLRAHLTLLDIHNAPLARDLCVLMLLDQLNSTKSASVRAEIHATLMYTYCGVVMPSYCYDRCVRREHIFSVDR